MEISNWFKGFEKGIARLSPEERSAFFSECGVVEKGHVYRLIFLKCTCALCKKGYITTPLLCECSRQSVIYSLHSLWKDRKFTVTLCHSILGGGTDCEMRIEVDR